MALSVLIIGTGITGAFTAAVLQKKLPTARILLWDKAQGAGGRMTTSRSPTDVHCTADLGAQYITTSSEILKARNHVYSPLLHNNIIEELSARIKGMRTFSQNVKHFVAPKGMNSVVKYFLDFIPKQNIYFNRKVEAIDEANKKFVVKTKNNSCEADIVISTIPIPQLFELKGSIQQIIESDVELEKITYSSRFALVWFYDKDITFPALDWDCRYMDDKVFRFVSIDNFKRGRNQDPIAVVFHTSVYFEGECLEQNLAAEDVLMKSAQELFPDWPKPSSVKYHKWKCSQVANSYDRKPGCVVLKDKPGLILGGDSFTESNFDGCISSAESIVDSVSKIWTEL